MTIPTRPERVAARAAAALTLAALLLVGAGCSTYVDRNARLRDDLTRRDYAAALTSIDDASREQDRLLNLLERGLVLHYADRWAESNTVFAEAEALAADLYTRSVSQAVWSLMTNDGAIDYRAAPYEMALVPYYRALNYAYLGEREDAVVEARKAEIQLREYAAVAAAVRTGDEDAEPSAALDDNAFLHYLRGMLLEWGGEPNEAFIAYRHAAAAYTAGAFGAATPPWLGADLLRTGTALGFREQLEEVARDHPDLMPAEAPPAGRGRVVLFLELGYAPQRVSEALDLPIFANDDRSNVDAWALTLHNRHLHGYRSGTKIAYWLRIAVPELVDVPPRVVGARISSSAVGGNTRSVLVEDVAGRSRRHFDDAQGKTLLKTIARGLTKYLAQEAAGDKGQVAGLLMNLFGAVTEQADTRGWLTLPHGIAMARLDLTPGVYDLTVDLVDAQGRSLGVETVPGVQVRAGDWRFLSRRVF